MLHKLMMTSPASSVVTTERLNIACEISGPAQGRPVILLHGWPDDVRTWDGSLSALHGRGWKTIAPYLRGFGATRFRAASTMRSGQLAALGQDVLDLANGFQLDRFAVVGHDWGARAAYIAASLAPERISHCVALSVGYGTNDPRQPLALRQARNYWYHWYMAVDRGEHAVRADRRAFTRFLWETWSPTWRFTDAEFERTAASFENPDWADVVLHSYRHRWGFVAGDPAYGALEAKLTPAPPIAVDTLVLHGGADQCNDPSTSEGRESLFRGRYQRVVLDGLGHFPQRESHEAGELIASFLGAA
jgi:pimeloyl-ACP methyl ester carboxylesterase